ncbi:MULTISPECIES: hypothetical protein [Streptacidiphilus]|uniref:Secreted protein n=1 Tax=Streptacidiphilus cavernicola TaxID=3342716 RepID=A0ABV6UGK6_9ACTN|nr:hypothetical protein [Streptacidiphilus jeojiense]
MARIGTGAVVTTLTASALALVTVLALQAKSSANVTPAASGKPGASASASAGASAKASAPKPVAVPARSGTGKRVVYALGAKRVWLVTAAGTATRTFTVQPSTLSPSAGTYNVYSHSADTRTGSDGVEIKNVVIFAQRGSTVFGFSSATDGTTPAPDPAKKTGGIRETLGDGQALFDFTVAGSKVVVIA